MNYLYQTQFAIAQSKSKQIMWDLETLKYSGGSNSEHSNTESIRKPKVSKFSFQMVRKQNGGHFVLFSNGLYHSKTELFKMAALA